MSGAPSLKLAEQFGARCSECPLKNDSFCPSYVPKAGSKFLIVARSPAGGEIAAQKPLSGVTGTLVRSALRSAGLDMNDAALTNVYHCYPRRKLKAKEENKAIECCKPYVDHVRSQVGNSDIPTLGLGPVACSYLVGRQINPMDWFGYPIGNVFPMYMPTLAINDPRYRTTTVAMLRRFAKWVLFDGPSLERFPEMPLDGPEVDRNLLSMVGNEIGVDVENAGDPIFTQLICNGVSDGNTACSSPFVSNTFPRGMLDLLVDGRTTKILHNMQHDLLCLQANNVRVGGPIFDTLVAHAALFPLMPHRLSFVAAQFFALPRWKTEFADDGEYKGLDLFLRAEPNSLRSYNAKDAYVTARLYRPLRRALERSPQAERVYGQLMQLSHIAMRMRHHGILINQEARQVHEQDLQRKIAEARVSFIDLGIPDLQLGKTGMHKSLNNYFFKTCAITPEDRSPITGEPCLDGYMLGRIVALGGSSGSVAKIVRMVRDSSALLRFVVPRSEEVKRGLPIQPDGRVHPAFSPWRVPSGRWGCSEPNVMNVPKDPVHKRNLRDMYVAAPGNMFVLADLDKAELRVHAHLSQSPELLAGFREGEDFHDNNARNLFDPKATCPECRANQRSRHAPREGERRLAKNFVYNANYEGSTETIYRVLVSEFPAITRTYVDSLLRKWKSGNSTLYGWNTSWARHCFDLGYVEVPTGVGRRAPLYRKDDDDRRFAINMAMQGVVAAVVNDATIALDRILTNESLGHLVIQCHDELVIECSEAHVSRVGRLLVEELSRPRIVDGRELSIPAELKVGQSWGLAKKYKL